MLIRVPCIVSGTHARSALCEGGTWRSGAPSLALPARAGTPVWYTAVVALPLSLADVAARLASGYYRQAPALQHDLRTLAQNAALFNGDGSELAAAAEGG